MLITMQTITNKQTLPTEKVTTPFFIELGTLLNVVRSFSTLIQDETAEQHINKGGLSSIWNVTNSVMSNLQDKISELEFEIATFFADYSTYKTIQSKFNIEVIQQKFIPNFKKICNEYFTIKLQQTNTFYQPATVNKMNAPVYSINRKQMAVVQ